MLTIFWGVLGLLLLVIDAMTSALLLLGFGLGSLIAMTFSRVTPFYIQLLIFIISGSLISIYLVPKLRNTPKTKNYEESLTGVVFTLTQDIKANNSVQEKVKGIYWNIVCNEDLSKGETLEVIKINKNTLEVSKKLQEKGDI